MTGKQALFETRRRAREGQKAQLKERIGQLKEQINGLDDQIRAKSVKSSSSIRSYEGVRDLWRKNLVQIQASRASWISATLQRVTALERDPARLEGERGMGDF